MSTAAHRVYDREAARRLGGLMATAGQAQATSLFTEESGEPLPTHEQWRALQLPTPTHTLTYLDHQPKRWWTTCQPTSGAHRPSPTTLTLTAANKKVQCALVVRGPHP
jgi:hypothetical protein